MTVEALTFQQEIWKSIIAAGATAVLVTVAGGITATYVTSRNERRREDFATRTKLLEDASRVAQGMFVLCQHVRRRLHSPINRTPETDDEIIKALDQGYLKFSADAQALETVLGARFGITLSPKPAGTPGNTDDVKLDVYCRWHQIWDLLTVYYFNLKSPSPEYNNILERNSIGYKDGYHSGINLLTFSSDDKGSSSMRKRIRIEYSKAIEDFAQLVVTQPMSAEGSR